MIETLHPQMNQQRLLILDDDPAILAVVGRALDAAGYQTLTAQSVPNALALLEQRGLPHLAIVDLHLPGQDGFAFCQTVQQYADLPIIMLTATTDEATIVRGLEEYAEDYITKPFRPRELVARVERVLRRIGDFAYILSPVTRVDSHLAIDFVHQRALIADTPLTLTPLETKLLYVLLRSAGQTVQTSFLLRRLWPREEVFEDTLRVHVHRLRQKIEPVPTTPRYIVTKRGSGYSFAVRP